MRPVRFPWPTLSALWVVLSVLMTWLWWHMAVTLNFDDPDDFLRLQQVRDLLSGQSWFDLTQHRFAPPAGLAMHWSRLVDIPLLLFLVPLKPLVGGHFAEVVAVIGAPLLALLALMVAIAAIARQTIDHDRMTLALACLLTMSAPAVFLQVHPARIDHHGWQIGFAALAVAALLRRTPRASGIGAGAALALYLNISIEGVPFAAGAVGIVGLLWALRRDHGERLTAMMWALAGTTMLSTVLTAPTYRWTEGLCDAVMPSHILAISVAAVATAFAVRVGRAQSTAARLALLAAGAGVTLAAFGFVAPSCLGSPFGHMDPVVRNFWYNSVEEGLPLWRQDSIAGASMIGFPLVGLIGTLTAFRRKQTSEMQRRWSILLALALVTLITATLVRRSAGVAHVVAVPGALVLIGIAVRYGEAKLSSLGRVLASALVVFGLSPAMPILAAAAMTSEPVRPAWHGLASRCDRLCALDELSGLPGETLLAGIDLGPIVIATTPHSVYGTGYHRLAGPLRETILFFLQSPDRGATFMRRHGFRHVLIASGSKQTRQFVEEAPDGVMARLVDGQPPDWLVEEPLGSSELRLFRLRD